MIDAPWGELSIILLILGASALTQGLLGFGFGIVAMTLLPLTLGLKDAVTFLALLNAVIMVLSLYWQKRAFRWRDARFLIGGALLGIPLGAMLVGLLSEQILYLLLGGTMACIGLGHFVTRVKILRPSNPRWEVPIGVASGILAASFNMGGPPLVAYVYSRQWTTDQAKAVLASLFVVTGFMRLFFIGLTGVDLPKVLTWAAIMVIPTALILRGAIALGHRIPHEFLRPVVFAYLGGVGLYYLFLH
ncbi:MAG: sulfite exporter TauE/SafE family protein [Cephaloticoccus sp.]|nr:sulfite exporter TauE/SafE family protein [Cephaloticoccus sp.]